MNTSTPRRRGSKRSPNLPTPEAYIEALTIRWQFYANVVSEKLEQQWAECCATYNTAFSTKDNLIRVLPCVTGSAKTLGAAVYCAMFIRQEVAGGILVVTRTIAQANSFVQEVRSQLPPRYADLIEADHSQGRAPTVQKSHENAERLTPHEIEDTKVLVITHAAYFDRILKGTQELPFKGTARRLTIIDEALNGLVTEFYVNRYLLKQALSFIDDDLADRYSAQYAALLRIQNILDEQAEAEKRKRVQALFDPDNDDLKDGLRDLNRTRLLAREEGDGLVPFRDFIDMQPLLNAMRGLDYDRMTVGEKDDSARRRVWKKVRRTLEAVEGIIRLFAYYHKNGPDHSLNSAQLILNQNLKGVVCLDATARLNPVWKLLDGRVLINDKIGRDVRSYTNVEMFVTEANSVGKTEMIRRIPTRGPRLMGALAELDPEKTLIVSHKDNHEALNKLDPRFRFSWWGSLDGKNDWKDCENIVIFGHNYLNELYAINSILTIQGLPEKDWFDDDDQEFLDTMNDFMQRHLAAVTVQAINRGQCRNVIDKVGNCLPTKIFIVVPRGKSGRNLLDRIKSEMPGIQERHWLFRLDPPKDDLQEGSSQLKLYELMATMPAGEHILNELPGFTSKQLKNLRESLSRAKHPLPLALAEENIVYKPGEGRGRPALLVKG